jgi:general secretion pathway protein G
MISYKKKYSGFTIVELLIVIVVIGILAALVIVTYNGIQQKARDTERKTDIKALQGHFEAYWADQAKYPTLTQANDSTFEQRTSRAWTRHHSPILRTLHSQQLCASTSANCYGYAATPANCDNASNW